MNYVAAAVQAAERKEKLRIIAEFMAGARTTFEKCNQINQTSHVFPERKLYNVASLYADGIIAGKTVQCAIGEALAKGRKLF